MVRAHQADDDDVHAVNGMDPDRLASKMAEYRERKRKREEAELKAVPDPEPEPEPPEPEDEKDWESDRRRSAGTAASTAGGGQIQSAVEYGYLYHPQEGKPYSASTRLLVIHLASTRGGQWSVNGPRSLPLSWLATRLDIPLRTLKRCLAELQEEDGPHGGPVIEVDYEEVGGGRVKVTYTLTKAFRAGAVAYTKKVVVPTAKGCGSIHRKHPEARLEEIARIKRGQQP